MWHRQRRIRVGLVCLGFLSTPIPDNGKGREDVILITDKLHASRYSLLVRA